MHSNNGITVQQESAWAEHPGSANVPPDENAPPDVVEFANLPDTAALPMDRETLAKLARLSQLELTPEEVGPALDDLNRIVALIDEMRAIDTGDAAPLAHPLDTDQPLRDDTVTESVDRETYQGIAPATRDGLYLVPRVVE